MAEQSSALDSSSGVVRMWVRIPAWPVAALVSLSKTLNHNCCILRMGHKAVGPVCCVMHVKEARTLIVKEKGLAPVFRDSCLEHPAGWLCARYKSYVLLLLLCTKVENVNKLYRESYTCMVCAYQNINRGRNSCYMLHTLLAYNAITGLILHT